MAATVLTANQSFLQPGLIVTTITIPTTVDGTSGATCAFQLPRAYAISFQAISSNFNGKTVELKGAPDGVNFAAMAVALQHTASGTKSVTTAETSMLNYQVSITGAPTATLTVTLTATCWR